MSFSVRRYSSDSSVLPIEARGVELVESDGELFGESLEIFGISIVSFVIGSLEGEEAGSLEGEGVGSLEGEEVGSLEGEEVGSLEGEGVGSLDGEGVGSLEGEEVGSLDGEEVGSLDGEEVGCLGAVWLEAGTGSGVGVGSDGLLSGTAEGVGCVNLLCLGTDTVSKEA